MSAALWRSVRDDRPALDLCKEMVHGQEGKEEGEEESQEEVTA